MNQKVKNKLVVIILVIALISSNLTNVFALTPPIDDQTKSKGFNNLYELKTWIISAESEQEDNSAFKDIVSYYKNSGQVLTPDFLAAAPFNIMVSTAYSGIGISYVYTSKGNVYVEPLVGPDLELTKSGISEYMKIKYNVQFDVEVQHSEPGNEYTDYYTMKDVQFRDETVECAVNTFVVNNYGHLDKGYSVSLLIDGCYIRVIFPDKGDNVFDPSLLSGLSFEWMNLEESTLTATPTLTPTPTIAPTDTPVATTTPTPIPTASPRHVSVSVSQGEGVSFSFSGHVENGGINDYIAWGMPYVSRGLYCDENGDFYFSNGTDISWPFGNDEYKTETLNIFFEGNPVFSHTFYFHKPSSTTTPGISPTPATQTPTTSTSPTVTPTPTPKPTLTPTPSWQNQIPTIDPFSDIYNGEFKWAYEATAALYASGIIRGYPDGTGRLGNEITRAEVVSILSRAYDCIDETAVSSFSDVTTSDIWFYKYVASAEKAGFIQGYEDGSFRPDESITREEYMTMMVRVLSIHDGYTILDNDNPETATQLTKFSDKSTISDWAKGYIATSIKEGLVIGIPLNDTDYAIYPQNPIIRAEAFVILYRAMIKTGLLPTSSPAPTQPAGTPTPMVFEDL